MWLLDTNVEVQLRAFLAESGIESEPAAGRGWRGLLNGELVSAAAGAGFTCILTKDRRFAARASKSLKLFPQLAIVIVTLRQKPWPEFLNQFRIAWNHSRIRPVEGRVIEWPSTASQRRQR